MTIADNVTLWDHASLQRSKLDRQYIAWRHSTNGISVHAEVLRRAHALRARGMRHFGIAAIFEAIRYDVASGLLGVDAEGWKLNNSYRSRLARELMDDNPELEGFFDLRGLRS